MKRRDFLRLPAIAALPIPTKRKRIAAITTTYFLRSHADDIITRFLEGYWINDRLYRPPCEIVSLYMDQVHPADIGYRLASAYHFPVVKSIGEALTLGTGKLAVDGVLLVAEHGEYPVNQKQQQLYPRFQFFRQIVEIFRSSQRAVPVYSDKHLSWSWDEAKQMHSWSRDLGFPMMAGSSVSVTFRRPELDYPLGVKFADALAVGNGWVTDGGIFHDLEVLQCFVERRKGGETGIRSVKHIEGEEVWRAAERGEWPRDLMRAALARAERPGAGSPEDVKQPVACLVEYNDGTHGAVLALGGLVNEYLAAFRLKGGAGIDSTLCYVPPENSNNFSMLVHGIVQMFETGKAPYPVERTLLTTGALSALMESAYRGHERVETPELRIEYTAPAHSFYGHGAGS